MLWLLIALVTAASVVAMIVPLLRARPGAPDRAAFDRAIYRDQLAEVARDLERGVLNEEQATSARLEIERRLLAAASGEAEAAHGGRVDPITATLLAGAVCGGAVAVYLALGQPHVADQPLAARRDLPAAGQQAAAGADKAAAQPDLARSAEALERKLKENPKDAEGWKLLGRTQAVLGRWNEAAASYKRAIELSGGAPEIVASYGEMLVLAADGIVTPAAREALEKALAGEPDNLAARFYLAAADAQAGKAREAIDAWAKLERDSPPDAPWLAQLRERIVETAQAANLPVPPAPERPAAAGGPSAADMAAAEKMSPAERQQMIRSMVDGLAAKLEKNPNDAAGWQRLANAYRVLGETKKADEAAARGKEAEQHAAAAPAASPTAASPSPTSRGPSAADMEAAAKMSPEERQQMIRTMVGGLAARLEKNPDDPTGWQRLANAYRVLGETAKAEDAAKRGEEAQARAGGATAQSPAAQSSSASAAPGPTAHDAAAAAGLKPEERQAMVRSMVEGLAAKLEKNPDDAGGWQRLARAWRVLGEDAKADEAAAKATALRPNDPEIPLDQARTIIDSATRAQGPTAPVPEKAVALMERAAELDPKQPEALWYLGLAEAQRGKKKEAAGYWQRLLQVLPPGSEDHKTVRAAIDALKPAN